MFFLKKIIKEAFPTNDLADEDEYRARYVDQDSAQYTDKVRYMERVVQRVRDSWVDFFQKDQDLSDPEYMTITEYYVDAKQNKLFFIPMDLPSEDEIETWFNEWRDKLKGDWSLVNTKDGLAVEIKISYEALKNYLGIKTIGRYR
jgi:hypothetical protein